ncbi:MAG: hypothetical protein HWN67_04115 [Candidatus Helarchaeota archaeon]|nr:hypothetical protein [Candidatus Helarchaeota archaeon]
MAEKNMPKCKICEKRIESGEVCEYHELARKNINENYDSWNEAYGGDLSLEEYIKKIADHEKSGRWVKEVAKYLLENKKF